jgi:hypothetical protein
MRKIHIYIYISSVVYISVFSHAKQIQQRKKRKEEETIFQEAAEGVTFPSSSSATATVLALPSSLWLCFGYSSWTSPSARDWIAIPSLCLSEQSLPCRGL